MESPLKLCHLAPDRIRVLSGALVIFKQTNSIHTPMHSVRLRCESSEYQDIHAFS